MDDALTDMWTVMVFCRSFIGRRYASNDCCPWLVIYPLVIRDCRSINSLIIIVISHYLIIGIYLYIKIQVLIPYSTYYHISHSVNSLPSLLTVSSAIKSLLALLIYSPLPWHWTFLNNSINLSQIFKSFSFTSRLSLIWRSFVYQSRY